MYLKECMHLLEMAVMRMKTLIKDACGLKASGLWGYAKSGSATLSEVVVHGLVSLNKVTETVLMMCSMRWSILTTA